MNPFVPNVLYAQAGKTVIGEMFGAYDKNPRVFLNAREYPFFLSEVGVHFYEAIPKVWLEFRIRQVKLSGSVYDTTKAYAVNDQVYYSPDYYNCIAATTAGQNPTNTPAKWSVVQIPAIFKNYLIQGAFSRYLKGDGQNDKAIAERNAAVEELMRQADILLRQEGQIRRLRVFTR